MVPLKGVSQLLLGVPFICPLKTSENRSFLIFSGGIKIRGNDGLKLTLKWYLVMRSGY